MIAVQPTPPDVLAGAAITCPAGHGAVVFALSATVETAHAVAVVSIVIDRTFVDAGIRWIVDYKTSTHEGAGRDAFLDEQARRYRDQLERYARLMSRLDPAHPIRLGLYFPLLGGWREWAPATV